MKRAITRRIAIGAVAGAAAVAVGVRQLPMLLHRRAGPYDDVLSAIDDRSAAALFGARVLHQTRRFDPIAVARLLRARMKARSLAAVAHDELAASRLTEVSGWVIPESLALAFGLAAAN